MPIKKLDHVNVRTTQLAAMIDWYTRVLGLQQGPRPDFPFGGAWMYAGETATVHLVDIEGSPATGAECSLKLEHFAFKATDYAEFETKLSTMGEHFRCSRVPSVNLLQCNVWDPDGNHIHIDFSTDE